MNQEGPQLRPLDLPGFTGCSFERRGIWYHFGATGKRPIYDSAEHAHVLEIFGLDRAQFTLYSPFIHQPQPGVYQTWWYALPLTETI